ncbi:MAG: esterase-like activity of phytase family protein, partial [Thermomicrobiales bacterium]
MLRTSTVRTAIALAVAGAIAPFAALAQDATPAATPATPTFGDVRVLGVATVPNDLMVGDTLVGGLSGIDYDTASGTYYVISDDRSDNQPARFYTASVPVSEPGIGAVSIDAVTTFLQADGSPDPNVQA